MGDENRSPLADISPRVTCDRPSDNKITPPHLTNKKSFLDSDKKFEIGNDEANYPTSVCQKRRHCLKIDDEGKKGERPPTKRHKTRRGKSKKGRWHQESGAKSRVRARQVSRARPELDAPDNTTQFIIEDHGWINLPPPEREPSFSESSDKGDFFSSPEEGETVNINNRFSDEFQELCRNVRAERIHQLSKLELEQEYFKLEDRVERLEHEIGELKKSSVVQTGTFDENANTPNKSPSGTDGLEVEGGFMEESQSSFVEVEDSAATSPVESRS